MDATAITRYAGLRSCLWKIVSLNTESVLPSETIYRRKSFEISKIGRLILSSQVRRFVSQSFSRIV